MINGFKHNCCIKIWFLELVLLSDKIHCCKCIYCINVWFLELVYARISLSELVKCLVLYNLPTYFKVLERTVVLGESTLRLVLRHNGTLLNSLHTIRMI